MNRLPKNAVGIFDDAPIQYTYYSRESMDNNQSMRWFIETISLGDCIIEDHGTQIVIAHDNYSLKIQIDAGGLGDFYSHEFVTKILWE